MDAIQQVVIQKILKNQEANTANANDAVNGVSPLLLFTHGQIAVHVVNQIVGGASSAPSHRVAAAVGGGQVGDSGPLPMPNSPPSSCPDPSIPSSDETNESGTGYLDKLNQLISYMDAHPEDPTAAFSLMSYIANLSQAGLMNSDVENLLDKGNVLGIIAFAIPQAAASAFFMGYGGVNGQAGMDNYLQAALTALEGLKNSNPYTDAMISQLQSFKDFQESEFVAAHTAKNGDLIWNYGGMTYDWTANANSTDRSFIQLLIGSSGITGTPNPFYDNFDINGFQRDYRLTALQNLLAKYKNPEIVISLWIMTVYDQQSQQQESGLANTTNYLTQITNNYATPLVTSAQNMGNMTPDEAATFVYNLYNGTNLVNILPQASSFAQSWQDNVFGAISQIQIPGQDPAISVGQVMQNFLNDHDSVTLAKYLNLLNPPAPVPGGTAPSSSSNPFQSVVNALTQGGALVTGTSKTVDTQLSTVASVDDQVVKLGSSMTSSTGGGFAQLMMQIVQNQVSH